MPSSRVVSEGSGGAPSSGASQIVVHPSRRAALARWSRDRPPGCVGSVTIASTARPRGIALDHAAGREPIPAPPRPVSVMSVNQEEGRAVVDAAFRRDRALLLRIAAVVTGDVEAAADIVGDAYADLCARTGPTGSRIDDPTAWLRVAVTNRSRSWVRRQVVTRRYLEQVGPSLADDHTDPDLAERITVRDSLACLDADQRAVVLLRYYLDLSEADTAAALGCPPGTVKSRLSRAMRRLRKELS